MNLSDALPTARAKALTLRKLTWLVDTDCQHREKTCRHTRQLHDQLRDLARSGMVPLIADGNGYWLGSVAEVEAYLAAQEDRIAEMSKRLSGLRRWRDSMTLHDSEQMLFHLEDAA